MLPDAVPLEELPDDDPLDDDPLDDELPFDEPDPLDEPPLEELLVEDPPLLEELPDEPSIGPLPDVPPQPFAPAPMARMQEATNTVMQLLMRRLIFLISLGYSKRDPRNGRRVLVPQRVRAAPGLEYVLSLPFGLWAGWVRPLFAQA